jgi:hypothetical protein
MPWSCRLRGTVTSGESGFLFGGTDFELYLPWNMPGGYNPLNDLWFIWNNCVCSA